jgi:hypothetical protein
MKKFKFDTNLIKSLIDSDFLLVEKRKSRRDILRFEGLKIPMYKQDISFLDPLEMVKTLKQMIRLFSFAKNNTRFKTDLHFFLDNENTVLSYLLKFLLDNKLAGSQISFNINENNCKVKNTSKRNKFCIGFILDKDVSKDKNFMKKQFYKGNYLFFKVNSKMERIQNSYKMYNEFDDYKKILFFTSFLRQILIDQYLVKNYEIQKKV